jgi:hypothetical protein
VASEANLPQPVAAPRGEAPVVLWVMTLLATIAALTMRGIEPALPGIWVGIDHVITTVKLGGAISSQLFAISSTAVVIGLVMATVQSSLPAYLRAFSVGAGVLTILAVMIAAAVRLPDGSRLVLAATTAILALMCVHLSARLFTLRAASLVVACVAFAGLVRVPTIVLSDMEGAKEIASLVMAARGLATVSALLEGAAVLIALSWLITQPGVDREGRSKPESPRFVTLAVLVVFAGVLTWLVSLGRDPEASRGLLLTARAATEMLSNPTPYLPETVRLLVVVSRWCLVVAVLVLRPRGAMMSASVALALVAAGSLEVPLCAVSLVMGSLALALHPGPTFETARSTVDNAQKVR